MGRRTVEHVVPGNGGGEGGVGGRGQHLRLRVDLHGVSVSGPGEERTAIRWEWIESIDVADGVDVSSARASVHFPSGAFGCSPERLGALLEGGRSLERRAAVIEELGGRTGT